MKLLHRYLIKLFRMALGFATMALGLVIAKQAYCLSPWNVLNDGVSYAFSITLGQANIIVGMSILLLNLLLRETFGLGMVLNIWLVGVFTDALMALNTRFSILPKIESIPLQIVFCLLSLVVNALGVYLYMSARMGAGPRDTLMVFLVKHLPLPLGACKLLLEALVCLTGWLIGGEVGVGSFLFVLCGGPILQRVFRLFRFDVKAVRSESVLDTLKIITRRREPADG